MTASAGSPGTPPGGWWAYGGRNLGSKDPPSRKAPWMSPNCRSRLWEAMICIKPSPWGLAPMTLKAPPALYTKRYWSRSDRTQRLPPVACGHAADKPVCKLLFDLRCFSAKGDSNCLGKQCFPFFSFIFIYQFLKLKWIVATPACKFSHP